MCKIICLETGKNYTKLYWNQIENLNFGPFEILEMNIWNFERKIKNLQLLITNSEVPEILLEDRFNIIQVIHFEKAEETFIEENTICYFEFVLAKNLRSGQLKLPFEYMKGKGFYEVEIFEKQIVGIKKSSRLAFDISNG